MSVLSDNARILLAEESYPGELLAATHALRDAFGQITGIDDQAPDQSIKASTQLSAGTAIAPVDAARCLVDFARTTSFLRGIRAAVLEARDRFAGERIRVLYAGCGPWAPLALPLCSEFEPGDVGFTLLDIHERSLEAARQLVDHFGLGEFIDGFVCADATSIRLESAPHVVLAETMQSALRKEPQLAVTANLAGQLVKGGSFVPQRIQVFATAADLDAEFDVTPDESGAGIVNPRRVEIGRILDLTPATAGSLLSRAREGRLPPVRHEVPELPDDGEFHLMLRTRVAVHGDFELVDYASGLTYPVVVGDPGRLGGGEALEFAYRTGPEPGFETILHTAPGIRGIGPADHLSILALNLESEHLLSPMNGQRLQELIGYPGYHRILEVDGQVVGFVIALEPGAPYDSQNYQWFDRDRSGFVYVDRVVVGAQYRGRGYASALYDDLFRYAREQGLGEVVCEFNLEPPNPASRAFHASYGFTEVGTRQSEDRLLSMQCATLRRR